MSPGTVAADWMEHTRHMTVRPSVLPAGLRWPPRWIDGRCAGDGRATGPGPRASCRPAEAGFSRTTVSPLANGADWSRLSSRPVCFDSSRCPRPPPSRRCQRVVRAKTAWKSASLPEACRFVPRIWGLRSAAGSEGHWHRGSPCQEEAFRSPVCQLLPLSYFHIRLSTDCLLRSQMLY